MKTVRSVGKLTNTATGEVVYMPDDQGEPDNAQTLEDAGLITRVRDKDGNWVSTLVPDPLNIRVLCWQATVNGTLRALGHRAMFENIPADFIDAEPMGNA
jgi:hypothetical protein